MRRRERRRDPLASAAAVRALLDQLAQRFPALARLSERKRRSLLQAVRHRETYAATETRRGRPGRFDADLLEETGRHLKALLARETGDRISLQTFVGHYLPILDWPPDVADALARGELSRLEAAQLARLTAARLGLREREAARIRRELLANHLRTRSSQSTLREKVREALGQLPLVTSEKMTAAVQQIDDLLRIDPADPRHLFYEQMKDFFFALRDIHPDEIDDATLDLLLQRADHLMDVIHALHRRRPQPSRTLSI